MANLSDLNVIITDMFGVLATIINEVVNLVTGDLLILTVVTAFVGLIVGVILLVFKSLKGSMSKSVKMK